MTARKGRLRDSDGPKPSAAAVDDEGTLIDKSDSGRDKEAAPGGYLVDYISGLPVRDTPEERDAVQVFAKRLVEDYGYPKSLIKTRPQFRVRKRPSDESRSYPVDIALFNDERKLEEQLFLIVECKAKTRNDGLNQLKVYMDLSPAIVGAWFNGSEHAYVRKVLRPNGTRAYEDLPNIPRHGQRIEDIGKYFRSDLKAPSNLKAELKDIRNHLAGKTTGITRDEALAQQVINILFCKIYDEVNTAPNDVVTFRSGLSEDLTAIRTRITDLFEKVKDAYSDVFDPSDRLLLDDASLAYVVGELQTYAVTEANRDAVGDAFEVFIGPALRGSEGQFFTPRNVVRMMVDILDPGPEDLIIDPACGSGGFLIIALEHVWRKVEEQGKKLHWSAAQIERRKLEVASRNFRGIDKDSFLARVTKAYMAIIGDGRGGVFCENSLAPASAWHHEAQDKIKLGTFDALLTNPPFGKKIKIDDPRILSQYDLGHRWKRDKNSSDVEMTKELHEDQPPQILFVERCLQLLKRGGRMGIVLPEAIFGMPTHEYVVAFLQSRAKITAIISMPEALFKTSGKGGTHAKVCIVFLENAPPNSPYEIFMAEAKWCGHDSRGNPTVLRKKDGSEELLDDVPKIAERYRDLRG